MGLFRAAVNKVKSGLAKTRERLSSLAGERLSEDLLKRLEAQLVQADVGVRTSRELVADLRAAWERGELASGDEALAFLSQQLAAYWPQEDRALHFAESGPTVILVVGVNGSGKTTSIAKLAYNLQQEGKSVMLAAGDTFRAAAVEQLEVWSERLGVELIKGQQGGDPAAVAFDACEAAVARDKDMVLIDTAGRLHTQQHLMRQLEKIRSVVGKKIAHAPHEVLLVLDATTGQNAINQARVFTESTDVTGCFLAKLDGTARGGMVVAIREQLGIPVKFIGVGETLADVEPFAPESFVSALLGS